MRAVHWITWALLAALAAPAAADLGPLEPLADFDRAGHGQSAKATHKGKPDKPGRLTTPAADSRAVAPRRAQVV